MQRQRTTIPTPIPQPSVAVTGLLLLAVFAAGAFLRFRNITQYEPFIADEAAYQLEARYLYSLVQNAWESLRLQQSERQSGEDLWKRDNEAKRFREDLEGRAPWYARPGHVYLVALGMAILGPDTVYLGGLISALFGTLSIPLVFGVTARLYQRRAGLIAAALFGLSGYQVAYSHSGLTEQDSLFFVLLAALAYVSGRGREPGYRRRTLFLAGLALGAAFVFHYRTLTFVLAFLLWEAFLEPYGERGGGRERLKSLLLLSCGLLIPIVLTEVPYYFLTLAVHFLFKAALPFQTYFEQLIGQVFVSIYTNLLSTQKAFSFGNVLTYPFLSWKLEGPLYPLLLAVSLAVCIARRRPADKWAAFFFLFPFFVCTFLQPRARYACGFLAFGTVLMGAVLAVAARKSFGSRQVGRLLLIGLFLGVAATGALHAFRAGDSSLSYRRATDFIRSQGGLRHVASYPLLSQVYVGVKNVPDAWPQSAEELERLYGLGHRFVVMDLLKDAAGLFLEPYDVQSSPSFRDRLDLMNRIEEQLNPACTVENLHVAPIQNLFEVNHNFFKTLSYYRAMEQTPRMRRIRVFDLKELFEKPPVAPPAAAERNDHVG
ncbi:MAG: glycosyltransferase family 39 protein [bacterium]